MSTKEQEKADLHAAAVATLEAILLRGGLASLSVEKLLEIVKLIEPKDPSAPPSGATITKTTVSERLSSREPPTERLVDALRDARRTIALAGRHLPGVEAPSRATAQNEGGLTLLPPSSVGVIPIRRAKFRNESDK